MTATQPDRGPKFTRRGVMKTTAVGVGSAAAIGYGGTRSAEAVAPVVLGAGAAGAAGLGYLLYEQADKFLGDERDLSGFTGKDALRKQLQKSALEMKSADERVMTSIQNNLKNSVNVALSKGKAAALSEMNAGAAEQDAVSALETAIDDYYATIQKNIGTHVEAQVNQWYGHFQKVEAKSGLTLNDVFYINPDTVNYSYNITGSGLEKNEVTLVNGNSLSLDNLLVKAKNDGAQRNKTVGLKTGVRGVVGLNSYDGTGNIPYIARTKANNAFDAAASKASSVKSQLSGFVSDLYAEYEPGDIPTEEIVDPVTAATELGTDTGLSSREAAAGMMGIPTSSGFSLRLRITDDNGKTTEVSAEIYTNAQPTDSGGNVTGFQVGETYEPSNFSEPIYMSYEYVDPATGEKSTDFTQIENPFTVIEAEDEEGNSVDTVKTTETNTQTAEVSKLEEQLTNIREEQQRLLEKQDEPESGGAGIGFFDGGTGGIKNLGLVAAAGAVIALVLGR